MKTLVPLVLLSLVACGPSAETSTSSTAATASSSQPQKAKLAAPKDDEAKRLIADSPEFSDYQFTNAAYTLPMKKSAMNAPALAAAKALAKSGWIAFHGDEVTLTEKAKSDRRVLPRPNGTVDFVPLAKKDVAAVTKVSSLPDGNVAVEFTWTWTPNEIGRAAFAERYAGTQRATATLLSDGSSWSVLRITAA